MRNMNQFSLAGRVMRTHDLSNGGKIVVIGNNRDYKKGDEWVNQAFYFSVAFFRDVQVKEGDFVAVSGTLSTIPDPNDESGKRTIISLVGDTIDKTVEANQKSSGKPVQNKSSAAKPQKSKPTRDASEEDVEGLFD